MVLSLDPQAQQLLSFVQQQTKRIDTGLEAKITQRATEVGSPLTKQQLEALLIQALPAHKDKITELGTKCMCHHSDGTNGAFVTQMVGLHKIQKEVNQVYSHPAPPRPARDPLFANFIMAKNADVLLLFNASKFDEGGRPLLMKIVARESMKDKLPDISNYHTLTKTPDVEYVADDAAYVSIKDEQEAEFAFGDAIAQVSLDGKGKEISRSGAVGPANERITRLFHGMNVNGQIVPNTNSPTGHAPQVTQGPQLDNSAVQRFEDRIQVSVAAGANFPAGGWLEVPSAAVTAKLTVQPGYLLEPGASGTVQLGNAVVNTAVAATDFSFNGSPSGSADVNTAAIGTSLYGLLTQNVRQSAGTATSGGADQAVVDRQLFQLVFARPEEISVGGAVLQPLGDRTVGKAGFAAAGVKAHVEPMANDPEKDGQEIVVDLAKGFLSGKEGRSLAGWRVEVGYRGVGSEANKWVATKAVTVGAEGSPEACLRLPLPNAPQALASNSQLELRVFNAEGVPAQRVLIPMTELPWA